MNKLFWFLPPLQRDVLSSAFARRKGTVVVFLAVTVLASACTVGAPLLFAHAVKVIEAGDYVLTNLIAQFVGFALLMAGSRFAVDLRMVLMNAIEQDVRLETNKASLAALLRAAGSIFVDNNPARVSELVNNLHASNTIYVQSILMVVLAGAVEMALSFAAIAGLVSWLVAAFVVIYGAASIWLTLRANEATTPMQRSARRKSSEGANLLGNVVNNIVSIKVFRGQSWVQGLYEGFANGARAHWHAYYRARLRFGSLQAMLVFVQYASILAMLVVTLHSPDLLNQVVLVSMILVQLNRPFEMVAAAIQEFAMARVLADMLQAELDQHPVVAPASGLLAMPTQSQLTIELDQLSFGYGPDEPLLFDRVSARFGPGSLNFIVGPSGVGKSSLLQILLGINDGYDGTVRVGGTDLRLLDKGAYLSSVGYVSQEPMLMNLSIRDNVLFGRTFCDEEVMSVLQAVRLETKVASVSEGLDYRIGERGQLLSGGERQRLAIARALIGRPKVLVLDEASSALDAPTENSIFTSLRDVARDTTVVAVTHRLGVISERDQVLDLGKAEPLPFERKSVKFRERTE